MEAFVLQVFIDILWNTSMSSLIQLSVCLYTCPMIKAINAIPYGDAATLCSCCALNMINASLTGVHLRTLNWRTKFSRIDYSSIISIMSILKE